MTDSVGGGPEPGGSDDADRERPPRVPSFTSSNAPPTHPVTEVAPPTPKPTPPMTEVASPGPTHPMTEAVPPGPTHPSRSSRRGPPTRSPGTAPPPRQDRDRDRRQDRTGRGPAPPASPARGPPG